MFAPLARWARGLASRITSHLLGWVVRDYRLHLESGSKRTLRRIVATRMLGEHQQHLELRDIDGALYVVALAEVRSIMPVRTVHPFAVTPVTALGG